MTRSAPCSWRGPHAERRGARPLPRGSIDMATLRHPPRRRSGRPLLGFLVFLAAILALAATLAVLETARPPLFTADPATHGDRVP